jgi:cytoskeleton protein RodZ
VSVLVLCVVIALTAYVMQDDDPAPPLSDVGSAPVEPPVIQASIVADAKPLAAPDSAAVDEDRESPRAAESPSRSTIRVTDPPAAAALAVVESPSTESAIVAGVADEVGETIARPPADAIRLSLLFREESWVEISDVNRRLLFGLQREGRRREVVGEPPISLLLGNAKGVELSVNDEPYVVPSSGVRGQVARFEIGTEALP